MSIDIFFTNNFLNTEWTEYSEKQKHFKATIADRKKWRVKYCTSELGCCEADSHAVAWRHFEGTSNVGTSLKTDFVVSLQVFVFARSYMLNAVSSVKLHISP